MRERTTDIGCVCVDTAASRPEYASQLVQAGSDERARTRGRWEPRAWILEIR